MLMAWLSWLTIGCAVVNMAVLVLYTVKVHRVRQLEFLLRKLVIDSFLWRHLPIWVPWAQAFDQNLRLTSAPEEDIEEG